MSEFEKRGIKERMMFKQIFHKKRPNVKYDFTPAEGYDYYDFKLASGCTQSEMWFYGEIKVREYELNLFNDWIIEAPKIVELQKLQHNQLVMNIHYDGFRLWNVTDIKMNYVGDYVKPNELYKYNHFDIVKMQLANSTVQDKGERWKDVVILKNNKCLEQGTESFDVNLINKRVDEIYQQNNEHRTNENSIGNA